MREYGHQAVVLQTALNPVIALELLAAGTWEGTGVLGPESFHAGPVPRAPRRLRRAARRRRGRSPPDLDRAPIAAGIGSGIAQPELEGERGRGRARRSHEGVRRRHQGRRLARPRHRRRRVHGPRRPVGLRQDDRAADGRRARGDLRGRRPDRRTGRQPRSLARPRHRDGLPELRALPAPLGLREHRLRPAAQEAAEGGDRPARPATPRTSSGSSRS